MIIKKPTAGMRLLLHATLHMGIIVTAKKDDIIAMTHFQSSIGMFQKRWDIDSPW